MTKAPHILKFGGTSVATTDKMLQIANKIKPRYDRGEQIILVVSAMGKSTDVLVNLAKDIHKAPSRREMDLLLSSGEQVSIALMAMALERIGIPAVALTGFQAGIETDDFHTKARIQNINSTRLEGILRKGQVAVVAGFQGINAQGDITTLGRGGSDTTAVTLAAALGGVCEIYTDVDGVYSVDPRVYAKAKKQEVICYDEMLEMASTGAGIMETRAIEIGHRHNVPLYIALNDMITPGTWIKEYTPDMERNAVTGLSVSTDCLMTTLTNLPCEYPLIARLFSELATENVIVDMISQTAPVDEFVSLSFTTTKDEEAVVNRVLERLDFNKRGVAWRFNDAVAKLSVVGVGMVSQSGVAANMFRIFADHGIPYFQVTTSEISISYTVPLELHLKAVHEIATIFDL